MTERRVPGEDHRDQGTPTLLVRFQPADIPAPDPDFKTVWRNDHERGTSYTLVAVPMDVPVEIAYSKPYEELDFTMSPTDNPKEWKLRGSIDSDIVQLLGMPVESPRHREIAPVLNTQNIEQLRGFGDVSTDGEILEVDLTVNTGNIAQLLDGLWRPRIARKADERKFSLGDNGTGHRMLPEKKTTNSRGATLTVRRAPAGKA